MDKKLTDRDRLIELIEQAEGLKNNDFPSVEEIADYLLANGVTVNEWVSVKDRLPKYTEEEMEGYRFFGDTFFPEFNVMIFGAIKPTTLYYDGERWYDEEAHCYCVTHWQPMPQPPKGE